MEMSFGRRAVAVIAGCVSIGLLTFSASAADAAQRYAAPGGSGTACSQVSKCDVKVAIEGAGNGDEVIVDSGTYPESSTITATATNLVIHGPSAAAKPEIATSAGPGLVMSGPNGQIRDLKINSTSGGASAFLVQSASVAERIEVTAISPYTCGLNAGGATIRDSICRNTATSGGVALGLVTNTGSFTSYARNVDAIAVGASGQGLQVGAVGPGLTVELDVRNVIAQGSLADTVAITSDATSTARLVATYSDYATQLTSGPGTNTIPPPGTGTNITAPPVFVDAALGNYHQQLSSPTRNAGAADSRTGTADIDGEARSQGAAIDIGADEFTETAPPPDTTPPETTIDKGPKKKSTSKKATFNFSASEAGSTFTCALDKDAAKPCTSPLKLKGLKKGKHTLTVAAADAAGNKDASAATYKWKVKSKPKR